MTPRAKRLSNKICGIYGLAKPISDDVFEECLDLFSSLCEAYLMSNTYQDPKNYRRFGLRQKRKMGDGSKLSVDIRFKMDKNAAEWVEEDLDALLEEIDDALREEIDEEDTHLSNRQFDDLQQHGRRMRELRGA